MSVAGRENLSAALADQRSRWQSTIKTIRVVAQISMSKYYPPTYLLFIKKKSKCSGKGYTNFLNSIYLSGQ